MGCRLRGTIERPVRTRKLILIGKLNTTGLVLGAVIALLAASKASAASSEPSLLLMVALLLAAAHAHVLNRPRRAG